MTGEEKSAEQLAREMLARLGMPNADAMTAGDVVELANLIADRKAARLDATRFRALRDTVAGGHYVDVGYGYTARTVAEVDGLADALARGERPVRSAPKGAKP